MHNICTNNTALMYGCAHYAAALYNFNTVACMTTCTKSAIRRLFTAYSDFKFYGSQMVLITLPNARLFFILRNAKSNPVNNLLATSPFIVFLIKQLTNDVHNYNRHSAWMGITYEADHFDFGQAEINSPSAFIGAQERRTGSEKTCVNIQSSITKWPSLIRNWRGNIWSKYPSEERRSRFIDRPKPSMSFSIYCLCEGASREMAIDGCIVWTWPTASRLQCKKLSKETIVTIWNALSMTAYLQLI